MKSRVAVVWLLCLPGLRAAAQEPPHSVIGVETEGPSQAYSLEIHRLSGAPVIDGNLDDPVWQEGNLLTDFVQLEPNQGQPATQRTEARIGYDAENLYLGIRCYDSEPERILAGGMRPDTDLVNDDSVAIVLDTFHDGRNGFQFAVNPVGAKSDALIRNEGEEINAYWDGLWEAKTARDAQGWSAEIAIPFKTLRFSSDFPQSWGFNIRRLVARGPELSFWKPMRRNWGFKSVYHVSQYGEIRGLTGIAAGARYQLTPYSLLRDERPFRAERDDQGRLGGDLKVNLSSRLVADLTVRTDFAEVEADQQQFNLDRFKLFYPEKRDFFLEGANLFFFGDRPEAFDVPEKFYFFFSRQIGLADEGRVEVPVLGGAKLSGRLGRTSLGFLNVTTDDVSYLGNQRTTLAEPRTNFTVLRLRQEIAPRSTIGLIGLNKDPSGGDYNRGAGFDWDLAFSRHWYSAGWLAQTDTPGLDGSDSAYSADVVYQGDRVRIRHRYTDIGEGFNPEMGFITRTGIRKNDTNIYSIITLRDTPLPIHRIILEGNLNHITDQQGHLQTQLGTYELAISALNNAGVAFLYYPDVEVLDAPLRIDKNAVIPPGHYRFKSLFTGITSGYSHKVGFTAYYHTGGYYGGDRLRTFLAVVIRPSGSLSISPQYDRVKVDAPWGHFVSQIAQTSVDYSFSPTLSTRTTLQWREGDNFRANFLIDWIYRPGSHFFLVYNDVEDLDLVRRDSGLSSLSPGRSIIAKLSRRMDF